MAAKLSARRATPVIRKIAGRLRLFRRWPACHGVWGESGIWPEQLGGGSDGEGLSHGLLAVPGVGRVLDPVSGRGPGVGKDDCEGLWEVARKSGRSGGEACLACFLKGRVCDCMGGD